MDLSVSSDVDEVWIRLLEEAGHVDIPVSYTHLDVYKRQVYPMPDFL